MSEEIHKTSEDYLRGKYGAYRGSFSWRDEEKAFNAGIESQASVIAQLEADLAKAQKVIKVVDCLVTAKGRYHTAQWYQKMVTALDEYKAAIKEQQ